MDKRAKMHERMREIEDRRIEILMEIARLNSDYDEMISRLNKEYEKLHEEHYLIHMNLIKMKVGT